MTLRLEHQRHGFHNALTGKSFFPELISGPFHAGLVVVFVAAALMTLIGALASLVNPGRYADEVKDV